MKVIINVLDKTTSTVVDKKYYRIVVFFKLDLPMVGDLTTFRIKGETEAIFFANDSDIMTCS